MTATEVLITDLHPYTEYYIRVVAQNKNGPGTPTEEQPVRTYSASKYSLTGALILPACKLSLSNRRLLYVLKHPLVIIQGMSLVSPVGCSDWEGGLT